MSATAKTHHFWRSAFFGMRQSPFVHTVAILTIAIALFAAGLTRGATQILEALVGSLGGEVEMTLYVSDEVSDDELEALSQKVSQTVQGRATVVPREVALKRLSKELGELGKVLTDLPGNPLPRSIEAAVPPSLRTPAALAQLSAQLSALPGITAVDYGEEAVERLSAIAHALRYGGLAAFLIVIVATVIIVAATLQLAIYARREEIEIQKLVGATDTFVKVPFLIEGVLQGVFGAALAVGALVLFSAFAAPRAAELFGFLLGPGASFRFDDKRVLLELLGAGATLGLCGSFVAVGRFLRV